MDTSTAHITSLPQDILFEILTRLPAKSIVQLRCASKFFCSLIAQPLFVDVYRNGSLTRPGGTSILFSLPSKTRQTIFYTINETEENQGKLQANRVRYLDGQRFQNLVHSRSANGLICLSNNDGDVTICNLSTRQHISLPRTPMRSSCSTAFACAVMGFDSISKTYKVLKSELCYDDRRLNHSFKKHWVLTLEVDKSWREIKGFIPRYPDASVHIDGVIYLIHWMNKPEIVAFDVGAENFRKIAFPCEFEYCCPHFRSPWVEVDGRLALINIHNMCQRSNIDIWTLEKSMEWEKHMVPIPMEESQIIRNAFTMDFTTNSIGEIAFLIQDQESKILLILFYAFRSQVWRKFEICGLHDYLISLEDLKNVLHVIEENVFFPRMSLA